MHTFQLEEVVEIKWDNNITTSLFEGKKEELKPHKNSLSDTGECREEREQASESLSWVFQMESPIKGIAEEKDKWFPFKQSIIKTSWIKENF